MSMIDTGRKLPKMDKFYISQYGKKLKIPIKFSPQSPYTRQEFKAESDINTIMRRYQSTGELPVLNTQYPQYLDCTGVDFAAQMQFIAGARSMFNELPSSIRARFDNDPVAFVQFCSAESNRVALAEMGLLSPEATKAALSPPPSDPPTAPPAKEPPPAS